MRRAKLCLNFSPSAGDQHQRSGCGRRGIPRAGDIARERGFKGLVTSLGAAALALTPEYKPDAITLDIVLPSKHPTPRSRLSR